MSEVIEILKLIVERSPAHGPRAQKALEIVKYDTGMWTWGRCSQMVAQILTEGEASFSTEERERLITFAKWSQEKIHQEIMELNEVSREYRQRRAEKWRKAHDQNQE